MFHIMKIVLNVSIVCFKFLGQRDGSFVPVWENNGIWNLEKKKVGEI